eukprot:2826411-Rhodomonas_salina.2
MSQDKVLLFTCLTANWPMWSCKYPATLVKNSSAFVLGMADSNNKEDDDSANKLRLKACVKKVVKDGITTEEYKEDKHQEFQSKVHASLVLCTIDKCFAIASSVKATESK